MAPKKWTTPEQEEWLQPWYSKYKETLIGKSKNYTNFFCNLNEAWLDEFPKPRPSTVMSYGPLTEEEKKIMDAAEKSCTNKFYNRFKNSMGSTRAGQQVKADAIDMFQAIVESISECEKATHAYQEQEAYSVLFYKEHAQPQVQEALNVWKATSKWLTSGQHVALVKKETAKAYKAETDEVKMQVKEFIQKVKQEKNKKEGVWSEENSNYQQNLNKLAAVVNKFLKGLHNATGLSYTLLAGGPSPESGGLINCYSWATISVRPTQSLMPELWSHSRTTFIMFIMPEAAVKRAGKSGGSKALDNASLLRFSPESFAADISQQGSPTNQHILAPSDVSDRLPPSSPFAASSSDNVLGSFNNSYSSSLDLNFSHGLSSLTLPDVSGSLPSSSANTSVDLNGRSGSFFGLDPNLPDPNLPDKNGLLTTSPAVNLDTGLAPTPSPLNAPALTYSPTTSTTSAVNSSPTTSPTTSPAVNLSPTTSPTTSTTSPAVNLSPTTSPTTSTTSPAVNLSPNTSPTTSTTSPAVPTFNPLTTLIENAPALLESRAPHPTSHLTSSVDSATSASCAPDMGDPDSTKNVAIADSDAHVCCTWTGHICKPSTHHVTANAIGNNMKDVSTKCPHELAGGSAGGNQREQRLDFNIACSPQPRKLSYCQLSSNVVLFTI
ncbi:hypothetical protein F4604DRAFT_1932220 [Suillus subluteus]|nr:hypothetical protein F4604DRAFT_1932220 [Suillus subluteus]